MVQITLESHSDETLYEFGKALEKIPEVLEAYLISGDYPIFAIWHYEVEVNQQIVTAVRVRMAVPFVWVRRPTDANAQTTVWRVPPGLAVSFNAV